MRLRTFIRTSRAIGTDRGPVYEGQDATRTAAGREAVLDCVLPSEFDSGKAERGSARRCGVS
jgi:hypothetical protein